MHSHAKSSHTLWSLCWHLHVYRIPQKVLASEVEVHGDIQFIENNGAGLDGGAMYLTSLGQLVLFAGARITFDRNMGV